ncbi:MAG: hypothetical protein Q8N65_00005 [bacterium]|nr:hypothetical protein [bacterium]
MIPKNYWHVIEKDGDGRVILDFNIINAPMLDVSDTFVTTARGVNAVKSVSQGKRQEIIGQEYVVMERNLAGLWTLTVNSGFPIA